MDDLSRMFGILSNVRQRVVVAHLNERGAVRVDELVDAVVQFEDCLSPQGDDFERVYTDLRRVQLPKLEDTGVVEYDRERAVIDICDDISHVFGSPPNRSE